MERDDALEAATGALAFMLLGSIFHELARAVRVADPERGQRLLHQLHEGVATTVGQFEAAQPNLVGNSVLQEAAMRVRTVIRAASMSDQGAHS